MFISMSITAYTRHGNKGSSSGTDTYNPQEQVIINNPSTFCVDTHVFTYCSCWRLRGCDYGQCANEGGSCWCGDLMPWVGNVM